VVAISVEVTVAQMLDMLAAAAAADSMVAAAELLLTPAAATGAVDLVILLPVVLAKFILPVEETPEAREFTMRVQMEQYKL
jgi:hypothetical protein